MNLTDEFSRSRQIVSKITMGDCDRSHTDYVANFISRLPFSIVYAAV